MQITGVWNIISRPVSVMQNKHFMLEDTFLSQKILKTFIFFSLGISTECWLSNKTLLCTYRVIAYCTSTIDQYTLNIQNIFLCGVEYMCVILIHCFVVHCRHFYPPISGCNLNSHIVWVARCFVNGILFARYSI